MLPCMILRFVGYTYIIVLPVIVKYFTITAGSDGKVLLQLAGTSCKFVATVDTVQMYGETEFF